MNYHSKMDKFISVNNPPNIEKYVLGDIKSYVPWAGERKMPFGGKVVIVVLKQEDAIVAYSLLHYKSDGICLGGQVDYPKIKWKIAWVEVNDSHRKKGYGTKIVTWIRDTFANLKIPIALYAMECGNYGPPFEVYAWYFKLGAIWLWNHDLSDCFMCFMTIEQIPEYLDDEDEDHDVKITIDWAKDHSHIRICKTLYESYENKKVIWPCNWLLKNSETECSACKDGLNFRGECKVIKIITTF